MFNVTLDAHQTYSWHRCAEHNSQCGRIGHPKINNVQFVLMAIAVEDFIVVNGADEPDTIEQRAICPMYDDAYTAYLEAANDPEAFKTIRIGETTGSEYDYVVIVEPSGLR